MLMVVTSQEPAKIRQVLGSVFASLNTPVQFYPPQDAPLPATDEDVVLLLGESAIQMLRGRKLFQSNATISSLRGRVVVPEGQPARYMMSYAPDIVDIDPGRKPELQWDVQLAARLHNTGSLEPPRGDYRYVEDYSALIARIEANWARTGKPTPVAFDTETLGLTPFRDQVHIVAMAFTDRIGKAELLWCQGMSEEQAAIVKPQVKWLMTSPRVKLRGANLKYDFVWMGETWGIECENFSMDTLLVGSLLDENRSNSLNMHAKIYAGAEIGGYDDVWNATHDKSRMDLVSPEDMLPYLGGDVDACLRVSERMLEELKQWPSLGTLYVKLIARAARTFERIERVGLLVDQDAYRRLEADLQVEITRLNREGLALLPGRLRAKYADNLSLTRSALLKDYFFTPYGLRLKPLKTTAKTGEPSTAKDHLEMFGDVPEAKAMCAILDQLNQANKTLSTYVVGFLKHLRNDGRFHPSYFLHSGAGDDWDRDDGGTVSGRTSCTAPALQTVPKKSRWAKRIRECLIAPPGKQMIQADAAQGELKIAACLSHEPSMIASYLAGVDLHQKTGAGLAGIELEEFRSWAELRPDEYDAIRGRAKAANFGLLYGMGPEGFRLYAWVGYRLKLTIEEATAIWEAFFATYPELITYHKDCKKFVRQHGYIVSPFGRIRHLPQIKSPIRAISAKAERQAVNSPTQSALCEITCWAIDEACRQMPGLEPCGMIHDSGIFYADEDDAEEYGRRIADVFPNLPIEQEFGWRPELSFTADAEFGPDLAHMKKIKILA